MILGVLFALIALTVPLCGGRLSRLGELRLASVGAVAAALVVQFVVITVIPASLPFVVAAALHLASYGLALVFVWRNRSIPGMAVLVLGGLLNLTAIAANGGVMPASATALETAGKPVAVGEFTNSNPQDGARLQVLGDVFAIPDGYPFANVFSVGDVLLVAGGAITLHTVGRSKLTAAGRREPAPGEAATASTSSAG